MENIVVSFINQTNVFGPVSEKLSFQKLEVRVCGQS